MLIQKLGITTLTSWLKYDREIQNKNLIYVNVVLICVNNIDKKTFKKMLIYVNFMLIYVKKVEFLVVRKFKPLKIYLLIVIT
jgi:hypothetical protein